jgi:hypothetical protein
LNINPKLIVSLVWLVVSCVPPEQENVSKPPTTPEITDFHLAQIQAEPRWELTAQRAQESQPETFNIEQLHLRLDTPGSPLELSSPLGQLSHPPLQGTLAQANWSEEKGWSGTHAQISGSHFRLQGQRIKSSPPYRHLHLEQVKARFER